MKQPVVFDAEKANKYGLVEALVYQKVKEGANEIPLLKMNLTYVKVAELEKAINNLVSKGVLFKSGIKITFEEDKTSIPDIKHKYSSDFEEIWKYYNKDKPNKGSKKTAYNRYRKSPLNALPMEIQKRIIDEYRGDCSDVKFMKHFATFLSEEVYENYAPSVCELHTKQGVIEGYLMSNIFYYATNDGRYGNFDLTNKIEHYKRTGILNCK